jgi:uncharacterized protein with PIN domain
VLHGLYVRALRSPQQLSEVFGRLQLARSARPFTRCLHCNAPLAAIANADALPRVPPRAAAHHERFSECTQCARVYWEGSHWRRMRALVDAVIGDAAARDGAGVRHDDA